VHNYIDTDIMILRKWAISASLGEQVLIPINMLDGSLICVGKGNGEWLQSAPHGAGRLIGRKAAKGALSLNESPMAHKSLESILRLIEPTVRVESHIRSAYNFKVME
jgi:RNA-splicing ligase RtcB